MFPPPAPARLPGVHANLTVGRHWLAAICGALVAFVGCGDDPQPGDKPASAVATPATEMKLKVLVADDPELAAAVRRWQREWLTLAGGSLDVVDTTAAEVLAGQAIDADLLLGANDLLGPLAQRKWIVPLRTNQLEADEFQADEILGLVWHRDARWGGEPMAVPLGSPVLTVCFRSDLFEMHGDRPPSTWSEYQSLVARLAKAKPDVPATCEPLAPGWAGKVFLARAAAYASHRNQFAVLFDSDTLQPQIASSPFVRALEELVAAGAKNWLDVDPSQALARVFDGRAAMALAWPTAAGKKTGAHAGVIAFAELPGSDKVYNRANNAWESQPDGRVTLLGLAGRLAMVSRKSSSVPSAMRLAAWLGGASMSGQISPASPATTMFRRRHLLEAGAWLNPGVATANAGEYLRAIESALARDAWLAPPQFEGANRYLAALDRAVHRAAQGEQTPQQALDEAAQEWAKITSELGAKPQREAYLKSLGE